MDNHQWVGNMWPCGIEVSAHTSLINTKGGTTPLRWENQLNQVIQFRTTDKGDTHHRVCVSVMHCKEPDSALPAHFISV